MHLTVAALKENLSRFSPRKHKWKLAILFIACVVGAIHYYYVSYIFEINRHFSHLSDMEREMSFVTEMGFYYSFFKTVVEERPFIAGITKLMYNKMLEYPQEVNAFNRFNIHPEVFLGALYRYVEPWINSSKECHMVHRGEDLYPIESCNGIGVPFLFYLEGIWILAGLTAATIFLFGTVLSGTILGGIYSILQYFNVHSMATRVMWSPNERENFAQPLILAQMCLLTIQLRRPSATKTGLGLQMAICILNCLCLLFWQFTQFIFLTQTAIIFMMDQLRIIDFKSLSIFLHAHFCGLHMAILLLQGNDMLKSSLYASFFLVVSAYCLFFSTLKLKVVNRVDLFIECWLILLRTAIVICASFWVKNAITDFIGTEEDSHVWDILKSKFTDFKNFHTLLYTCHEVFDFFKWHDVVRMILSSLLPVVIACVLFSVMKWIRDAKAKQLANLNKKIELSKDSDSDSETDSGIENNGGKEKNKMEDPKKDLDVLEDGLKQMTEDEEENETKDELVLFLRNLEVDPGVFYNICQMTVFGFLAVLVMRLKLLFVPHMCLVSSLVMNLDYFPSLLRKWAPWVIYPLVFGLLAHGVFSNVKEEISHQDEYTNWELEELLTWIKTESGPGAVFAASMPVSASIALTCRRAIVNHPHYEHSAARERTYTVYKLYGRFTPEHYYQELSKLRVTHVVLQKFYCFGKTKEGLSYTMIWDTEVPANKDQPVLCRTLLTEYTDHFYMIFENAHFVVFRVHDYSVNYMPRSYDT